MPMSGTVEASNWPLKIETQAEWRGVTLHHWRARPGLIPERTYQKHQLNIGLGGAMNTFRQTAGGRQLNICRRNGLCLVPSGQPIGAELPEPAACLSLLVQPEFVNEAARAAAWPGPVELIEAPAFQDPLLEQIGLALLSEAQTGAPPGNLYAETLSHTLALHLLKHYSVKAAGIAPHGGLPGYKLRRVQDFMRDNLAAEVSLGELAEVAGLSPFHFARAFKRATGETPQRFLTHHRIERAKQLLAQDRLPLVEISARVGFKNQSHFTTVFHRFTGATPKAWRNRHAA